MNERKQVNHRLLFAGAGFVWGVWVAISIAIIVALNFSLSLFAGLLFVGPLLPVLAVYGAYKLVARNQNPFVAGLLVLAAFVLSLEFLIFMPLLAVSLTVPVALLLIAGATLVAALIGIGVAIYDNNTMPRVGSGSAEAGVHANLLDKQDSSASLAPMSYGAMASKENDNNDGLAIPSAVISSPSGLASYSERPAVENNSNGDGDLPVRVASDDPSQAYPKKQNVSEIQLTHLPLAGFSAEKWRAATVSSPSEDFSINHSKSLLSSST